MPHQVQLVNERTSEQIRFSNAVANTGAGALEQRSVFPAGDPSPPAQTQDAVQVRYSELVSTANPDATFVEQRLANNVAWVAFDPSRDRRGNPTRRVAATSPCSGGLCGTNANR